ALWPPGARWPTDSSSLRPALARRFRAPSAPAPGAPPSPSSARGDLRSSPSAPAEQRAILFAPPRGHAGDMVLGPVVRAREDVDVIDQQALLPLQPRETDRFEVDIARERDAARRAGRVDAQLDQRIDFGERAIDRRYDLVR